MKFPLLFATCFLMPNHAHAQTQTEQAERRSEEHLSFQTFDAWEPRINLNADVAMVYGIDDTLPARIKTWKAKGYVIHVMTGVAWGEYQDYLFGKYDGKNHEDEAQTDKKGEVIGHGVNVPYMSPGVDYGKYLSQGVKKAIDAGADAVHLEEPEFWARAGWGAGFKREWKEYYGEEWVAPDSSPDAQYRASKLKYYLYKRALSQVFDFVKAYGKQIGREIPCYVPTHSLINYAKWGIVSPQSSLLDVGCDGYIAQVWTGTARSSNVYRGVEKERTFETAFLEYGAMQNLVRASGRRMWFLNDPIEDDANHSWDDYRTNWESTLTASLLQPEIWRYEIMPWPHRIFTKNYPVLEASQRPKGEPVKKVPIPKAYETELQSVIHALGKMKQPLKDVKWEKSGTRGIGILIADTLMFQREQPVPSDPWLGSFYGLALPLLSRGVPVDPVQIESAGGKGFLNSYKVLVLTYEGQKPPQPEFHRALRDWVRQGGALVVIDNDRDPYNAVQDWWNKAPMHYATPREHLFEALGLPKDGVGMARVGKGFVVRENLSPAALSHQKDGDDIVRASVQRAADAIKLPLNETNALVLRRGPYIVAAGLDESIPNVPNTMVRGRFLDLFDADLPIKTSVEMAPGKRELLFDLDFEREKKAHVLAAACRVDDEKVSGHKLSFEASGISDTSAVVCAMLPRAPKSVRIGGEMQTDKFDFQDGILRLRFANSVTPIAIEIGW